MGGTKVKPAKPVEVEPKTGEKGEGKHSCQSSSFVF